MFDPNNDSNQQTGNKKALKPLVGFQGFWQFFMFSEELGVGRVPEIPLGGNNKPIPKNNADYYQQGNAQDYEEGCQHGRWLAVQIPGM